VKLVADENLWGSMIAMLRSDGHEVYSIIENHAGIKDREVLQIAYNHGVLLITSDKGFGGLVFNKKLPTAGVLLLSLDDVEESLRNSLVAGTLRTHGYSLPGKFSVLTEQTIRIRSIKHDN
jgi:predicted nuclease of predicted toxin-antitoxin system